MDAPELAVVLPVYNEQGTVAAVIRGWIRALDALGMDYRIHAYDDGSTDDTPKILGELARSGARLSVHSGENAGHGPTILRGYRENAEAVWIFQVDSDDEMGPEAFAALWSARAEHDLLIGVRERRAQPWSRRLVSATACALVRALYGPAVTDVNAPYRLMRGASFRDLYAAIPGDTFAPNLVLSGAASLRALRVFQAPVAHRPRRSGQVSIRRLALLRAFAQTVRLRATLRRRG